MAVNLVLRRLVLLGTPLVLAVLEIFHPSRAGQSSTLASLLPRADWWFTLHLLQLPLFGLMAVAVYLLTSGLRELPVTLSRLGVWLFLVFFLAYDAVVGIATGVLVRSARSLTPEEQAVIGQVLERLMSDPITGNLSVLFALGALGWITAVVAAAIALERAGAPSLPVIFIALALLGPHNFPAGTLGMAFFFLGAAWLEFAPRRPTRRVEVPAPEV